MDQNSWKTFRYQSYCQSSIFMVNQILPDIDAYHSAIVRIATVRDRDANGPPTLVFTSIELVAASRPEPESTPLEHRDLPQVYRVGAAGLDLAFRRVAMGAVEAVAWYRSLGHAPTLPLPRRHADRGRYDGKPMRTAALNDEPTWPSLSTPLADPSLFGSADDFYPTPFIGAGAEPARVHRQLAPLIPLTERLMDDAGTKIWLRRRIHFDVARHNELLGGAVLIVPDPDVRAVRTSMARDVEGREYFVGEVLARRGRKLDGLTLTLFEERFGAMHLFKTFAVGDALMIIQATDQLEHTGHALSHVTRGLVDQQKALPYLRTINFELGTVNRRVRVETQDSRRKGARATNHTVDETTRVSKRAVGIESGAPIPRDAVSRFYSSSERRRTERLARQQDLQWFDTRDAALCFIRERIGRARETILIVDPYADGKDLFDFGHFVTRRDIGLHLLTSRLPFANDDVMRDGFAKALRSFAERDMPTPEIKLLRGGKRPAVHDRFLVIDGDVWLTGNSLNAIGERASVMLKLPDPESVHARLEHLFDEAEPLRPVQGG